MSKVAELKPGVVCLSALPPFAVGHARALYLRIRTQFPGLDVVVCLWHFEGDLQKVMARIKLAHGHGLFTTLPEVLQHTASRAKTPESSLERPTGSRVNTHSLPT